MNGGVRLAIDYGTSHTVAVLQFPDSRSQLLLFDGSPLLPSAVYAAPDGHLLVGQDARRCARLDPTRFEPNPKRHIDEGEVLLGERAWPVVELVAAVLTVIAAEAVRVSGMPANDVVITFPVAWGRVRRAVLVEAAALAGFAAPTLLPEPVAAASYFASLSRHGLAQGHGLVVYWVVRPSWPRSYPYDERHPPTSTAPNRNSARVPR